MDSRMGMLRPEHVPITVVQLPHQQCTVCVLDKVFAQRIRIVR